MSINFIHDLRTFKVEIQWFLPRRIKEEVRDEVPRARIILLYKVFVLLLRTKWGIKALYIYGSDEIIEF